MQSASLHLNLPADGEHIDIPAVNITMFPNLSIPITHITVVPTPITATVCAVAAPGPIKQTVTASLPADAQTFGASCVLTATVPVAVEIYGPLSGFTISGTNLPFVIPPIQAFAKLPLQPHLRRRQAAGAFRSHNRRTRSPSRAPVWPTSREMAAVLNWRTRDTSATTCGPGDRVGDNCLPIGEEA